MSPQSKVFLLVLSGEEKNALAFAHTRYPANEIVVLSKTALREGGWKGQLRQLRQLRGEALVIFTDSLSSLQEPMLLKWATIVHRCRETVLADSSGRSEVSTRKGVLSLLPQTFVALLSDVLVLGFTWVALKAFQLLLRLVPEPVTRDAALDVAFLYPSQSGLDVPGGALTHVTGFLSGLVQEGARVSVYSGRPFRAPCDLHHLSGGHQLHLFRETATLSYNCRFVAAAWKQLARGPARLLYQRHGRFAFAGTVLSRLAKIPLVLEYNASEDWMAKYWDPARFSPWLRLCEKVSVDAASLIVVVSSTLKQELIEEGIPAQRILVNQNAVDPERFHPICGGEQLRRGLGFLPRDIVVCFVGTFSYWHGIAVLGEAIQSLLCSPHADGSLKFLLVGDGLLAPQMRSELEPAVKQGSVIFTGSIPHGAVRAHLDAADILVSPHIPMPGGTPFFGSPTKLFEYMAMGKAIAASDLDQLSEVLEHGRTALLVRPGDAGELARAIQRLAADSQLRLELGRNAMETALARHTWRQNARRVLEHYADSRRASTASPLHSAVAMKSSPTSGQASQDRLSNEC